MRKKCFVQTKKEKDMSKTKKYLLLSSGILLLLWGAFCGFVAIRHFIDPTRIAEIENWFGANFGEMEADTITWLSRFVIAFLASSTIVSLAFGGFTVRYTFYDSAEFEEKRSILITMAALAFVVVNPVIAGLFLAATLVKDKNYVPRAPELEVDILEDKLKKLATLKEKNLISEEEYEKLRANILEAN